MHRQCFFEKVIKIVGADASDASGDDSFYRRRDRIGVGVQRVRYCRVETFTQGIANYASAGDWTKWSERLVRIRARESRFRQPPN